MWNSFENTTRGRQGAFQQAASVLVLKLALKKRGYASDEAAMRTALQLLINEMGTHVTSKACVQNAPERTTENVPSVIERQPRCSARRELEQRNW